jgi:hypothetical protein
MSVADCGRSFHLAGLNARPMNAPPSESVA